jgi:hypothetical protein
MWRSSGVSRAWSKVFALSVVLLGIGYVVAGVLLCVYGIAPNSFGAVMAGVGVFLAIDSTGVRRCRARARVAATVLAFVSALYWGELFVVKSGGDPDLSDLANNVAHWSEFGLAGLSTLVLATAVIVAVAEA